MVGNIVDVGWATIKSGCLPITGSKYDPVFLLAGAVLSFKRSTKASCAVIKCCEPVERPTCKLHVYYFV
jgi:hypothetical protein